MPTMFEDEDVILYLLRRRRITDRGTEHVISNTTFVRCRLLGPIHVRLGGDVLVENCTFTPSQGECVQAAEPDEPYVGAFAVSGCSFVDCEFDDVKIVVPSSHELLAAPLGVARAAV
jgi:hypothetical protein